MKAFLWIMIPLTLLTLEQMGQSPNCRIIESFDEQFANATDIFWQPNKNGWDAKFCKGSQVATACFDLNGNLLKIETQIAPKDLPLIVRCAIHKNYTRYSIARASTVDTAGFSGYKLKLANDSTTMDVNVTKWGELIELATNQ